MLGACREAPVGPSAQPTAAEPAAAPQLRVPTVPRPEPALTRKDLLAAVAQASSDYVQGAKLPSVDPLVGRAFEVRIAFGCAGPTATEDQEPGFAHWSWSEDRKSIRLGMQPIDWKNSALIAQSKAGESWEAIEGFWIPRPWLIPENCPTIKNDPIETASTASPQNVGLAAVFATGGSRIGRREGRAYQTTIRREGDAELRPPAAGYRLVLNGRVEVFPSGRGVQCRATHPDERPVCIVAARLDRVAFEQDAGKQLAEWRTD